MNKIYPDKIAPSKCLLRKTMENIEFQIVHPKNTAFAKNFNKNKFGQ